jgi:hypothetical protein
MFLSHQGWVESENVHKEFSGDLSVMVTHSLCVARVVLELVVLLLAESCLCKGNGLWSHDKVRAHKGGVRIGKTPQKLDSICCPQCRETKADTLKWLRPIGEGDQELEKRLDQEELT